jgi:hypothetical protein
MPRSLLILVLAAVLAGCGRVRFARPGATHQEFINDYVVCENATRQNVIGISPDAMLAGAILAQGRTNRCMESLGWSVGRGNGGFRP